VVLADKPLESDVPISFDAVGKGRREMQWRADAPAELFWVEAADDGDPRVEAEVRDRLFLQAAPFVGEARPVGGLAKRFAGVAWGENGEALVEEGWRATRLRRIQALNLSDLSMKALYEGSSQDAYGDPGHPLMGANAQGAPVFETAADGDVWFTGEGSTPEGDRPFLSTMDMKTGQRDIVWRSSASRYEEAEDVLADGSVLIRREGAETTPNYWLVKPGRTTEQAVTDFANPYGDVALPRGQVLTYKRADGVPLTAVLFTPPGWKPEDGPLPTILHAYPVEYVSADAAGQMTGSPNRFPAYATDWSSIVQLMTLRGYAVLYNTSLPIVGAEGKQPNDTYVEQLVAGAKAAIDEGARLGVVDPNRMGVTGHSYGAFMTANLLAHSDLFKAGVATSGAYNRTLTPYGFQREERTYWQAPELYYEMSPFSYADRIKAPLSLMHGINDDNQGTFPVQSERFYAALKGQGATVRLTMLPLEAHRYAASESLNQMVWEWDDWFGRYVKNVAPAAAGQ
jgi:dipeptidyl aminopeptidase/acylaminoacyl peptidase